MNQTNHISGITSPYKIKGEIYFIGIGGIGMSALARFFKSLNWQVSGYDKTETSLTKQLETEGIHVHYMEDINLIPKYPAWVVYTPAIPQNHTELTYYQKHQTNLVKRSDMLQIITKETFNICIAGTHGKTTISTLTAHILRDSGYGCTAFLGGVSINYQTNFWLSENNVCVIEADEYDRSFLKLTPNIAVITAMDADHLDIYGNKENMEMAFVDFSKCIKDDGLLIKNFTLKNKVNTNHTINYSLNNVTANVYAKNIIIQNGGYQFDVVLSFLQTEIKEIQLNIGGLHNIENCLAAIAIACNLKIEPNKIKNAITTFKGIKRRFEYIIPPKNNSKVIYIDDYAHHPEELRALIHSTKNLFPQIKNTLIFQPHLFSRTKDLAIEFAEVLDMADEVVLLPIYPAREKPIPGVTSKLIFDKMKSKNKHLIEMNNCLKWVNDQFANNTNKKIIITAGAGNIDTLIHEIKETVLFFENK